MWKFNKIDLIATKIEVTSCHKNDCPHSIKKKIFIVIFFYSQSLSKTSSTTNTKHKWNPEDLKANHLNQTHQNKNKTKNLNPPPPPPLLSSKKKKFRTYAYHNLSYSLLVFLPSLHLLNPFCP